MLFDIFLTYVMWYKQNEYCWPQIYKLYTYIPLAFISYFKQLLPILLEYDSGFHNVVNQIYFVILEMTVCVA